MPRGVSLSAPQTYAERFWAKVDRSSPDGCWPFTGKPRYDGYAKFGHEYAHRVAYVLAHGPIPPDKEVCHRCDVRHCCRPSDLFLGTHLDNMRDAMDKGRLLMPERRLLQEADIQAIRFLWAEGLLTQTEIARDFGVSQPTVHRHLQSSR